MPLISSETSEAAAWLIAQPAPEKRRSSTTPGVVDLELHLQHVAAERVVVLELVVGVVELAPVAGLLVVVEDLLAVEVVH